MRAVSTRLTMSTPIICSQSLDVFVDFFVRVDLGDIADVLFMSFSDFFLGVSRGVSRHGGLSMGADSMVTGVSGTMPGEGVISDRCISGIPTRVGSINQSIIRFVLRHSTTVLMAQNSTTVLMDVVSLQGLLV